MDEPNSKLRKQLDFVIDREALKRFNGDFDVLYERSKTDLLDNGQAFEEVLKESALSIGVFNDPVEVDAFFQELSIQLSH